MEQVLERRFDRLESRKADLLERLDGLSDEELNRSPGDGGWSVAQVLSHMSRAEDLSVRYIRQKTQAEAPRAGLICAFKSLALSLVLRSPLKFKASGKPAEVPEWATLVEVAERWGGMRMEMAAALEAVPRAAIHQAVFRHPRVGMISLDHALRFMEDHFDHHLRQIDRVLAAGSS